MKPWAGARYGFLAPPRSSNEPRLPPDGSRFSASFPAKYLGSGPVQHYTDYEGCLQTMNKLFTSYQLHNKRKLRRRSAEDKCELVLTFTPNRLFIVNRVTQVLEEICKLEAVYLVHPHPTKDRVFGLLTDNWMSGTLHCSVYVTVDNTTGSDVLYGFRKACRIWTDMHQLSDKVTPLSVSGPSSTLPSMPSDKYDNLETLQDLNPPKIVVSYDDKYCNEEPQQESTDLTTLSDALNNLKSVATATDSGECTPTRLSENSSSDDLAVLKPLLQSEESQSTNKSRSSQFAAPQPSQTSTDSKMAELQPLLLFGQDSNGAAPTSFCLGADLSSSPESRNLSLRKVSFAPNVVTSEITVPKTEKEEKSFGAKFLSNIHSLKSMVVGNSKTNSSSSSLQYPCLFIPPEYLLSPSPDSSAVTTGVAPPPPRPQTPPPKNDPPVCNDLIDLSTEESGCTLKSDATSQSPPCTPPGSIQRMEGSFSSPALFTQAEKDLKTCNEINDILSNSTIAEQGLSSSTIYESTTMSSGSSSSSSLASSPCSSILSFVQSSPPSSMRELIGLNHSDSSSLNHSKHTLLTASSCDTQNEWSNPYNTSPPFQNVLQLINFESSTDDTDNDPKEPSYQQQSCSLTPGDFSLAGPSGVQNESTTLAKLFQDYATDSSLSSPTTSQAEIIPTLQSEPHSSNEFDFSDESSVATLVKLFEELASQTSRVSSQFSELGKIMSTDSILDSEATLAKLFKQCSSQTTTLLSADSNLDSEATLAKLFKQSSSQTTTTVNNQTASDFSIQTSTDINSQTSSNVFPSALSLSTERASHDLTTSTSSGSTLPIDIFGDDLTYSLNTTASTSEPTISTEYSSNMSNQNSESTTCKWSAEEVINSSSDDKSVPEALLALTQSALSTSLTVSESKVIDIPSLMDTLQQVTSLLATSHTILNLTLATLKAKLAAQPSGVCVCTCQDKKTLTTSTQVETSVSQSEPALKTN